MSHIETAQSVEMIPDKAELLRRLCPGAGPIAPLRPFLLSGPEALWLVTAGRVDVLLAQLTLRGELTERRYLFSVGAGQLLCGLGLRPLENPIELVAVGSEDVTVRRLGVAELFAQDKSGTALLGEWGSLLGHSARSQTRAAKPPTPPNLALLTDNAAVLAAVSGFHQAVVKSFAEGQKRERAQDKARLQALADAEAQLTHSSLKSLASVLADSPSTAAFAIDKDGPLHSTCRRVWAALGIEVGVLPALGPQHQNRDPVRLLADLSRLRVRPVRLRGEWWKRDYGPLLAIRQMNGNPVALLPTSAHSYELYDDTRGIREAVSPAEAQTLAPQAYCFYRRLPERPLGFWDVARFCSAGTRRELVTIVLLGIGSGLLAVVPPAVTGALFETVIPGAQRGQLLQLCLALCISALSIGLLGVSRSLTIQRLEGKISAALNAAVWDRLLGLPVRFFRAYSAGDLAQRAFGIQQIFSALSGQTIGALLTGLYGLFSAALMFVYDPRLALLGMGLVFFLTAMTAVSGIRQQRHQRPLAEMRGRLSSLVLQLIAGLPKLRVTVAEPRAFAAWVKDFVALRRHALAVRSPMQVFEAMYPVFALMVLCGLAGRSSGSRSSGQFLGFYAAFQTFLAMSLQAARALLKVAAIAPVYERLRPLLESVPEVEPNKVYPGMLTGELELSHVSFRYHPEGGKILDDVSLRIQAGEFIAITGPSGSGKSTLLRLLLGFEKPSSGALYYDRQDLQTLDLGEVRRQFGVVLQDGKLFEGSLFENIVGSANLTHDDAMEAARLAGFDRDLAQLPMGLHTPLQQGGASLSGGQRQRLLIARAIVHRPKILYFDEATSALDNQTQATVAASIDRLAATRVVIAHRLSTIVNADRIVVLQAGRIVEIGTYRELMAKSGLFAELARRQLSGEP